MKLHEHQAKEILRKFGVRVPAGQAVFSVEDAERVAGELSKQHGPTVVVKAQIHAGGRGKGGGIKLAKSPQEAREHAQALLGRKLVTPQTGAEGKEVHRLLIEQGVGIARELYLAILLDRGCSRNMVMVSREGGMDIEEVAAKYPEKIIKEWIDPAVGLKDYQCRNLAYRLELHKIDAKLPLKLTQFLGKLYEAYLKCDCSLLETNPLIITQDNEIMALDCKMQIEDNALYRHADLAGMRDSSEESPLEVEASKFGLNYISMDGNIGCMVNGAGLAMGTMDTIKLYGGEPANFLDVGGGATKEQVAQAFRILVSDSKVKGILVNIFGGIMKCDVIAEGIIEAAKKLELKIPLTVRLKGTNVEQGKKLLAESGLNITAVDDMAEAAQKAIASIRN